MEAHLQEWQDETVETIVAEISKKGKVIKPYLVVSVDGHPIPNFLPPNPQGRHEIRWANKQLIDAVFNMDYKEEPDFEKHELITKELRNPFKAIFLLGNYDENLLGKVAPRDPSILVNLVYDVQKRWPGSVGVYLSSQLSDPQIQALANGPFKNNAVPIWQTLDNSTIHKSN